MTFFKQMLAMLSVVFVAFGAAAAPDYLTVDFYDDVTARQVAVVEQDLGFDLVPNSLMFSKTKITRLNVMGMDAEAIIKSLEDTGLVKTVEVEQTYSMDPFYLVDIGGGESECLVDTWYHNNDVVEEYIDAMDDVTDGKFPNDPLYLEGKQWNMTLIGVEGAWKVNKGKGAVVAVLDTGVSDGKGSRKRVPDLKQTNFVQGYNFINDNTDAYDGNGHGTHVSGTVAQSTNNNLGVVGIAFEASIMPVKVLSDEGYGSTSDIAEAIIWATDNGANVINMSLGGGGYSKVMADAVKYAYDNNVFVACAAGNSGRGVIEYPAAYPGCHAVSSVGKAGNLAYYSSYGTNGDGVFIAAPGGDQQADGKEGGIWQDTIVPGEPDKHGFFPFQGTSMATPHVAGVAALVVSTLGAEEYDVSTVSKILSETAVAKPDESRYGNGLLNAKAAVEMASQHEEGSSMWILLLSSLVAVLSVMKFKRLIA